MHKFHKNQILSVVSAAAALTLFILLLSVLYKIDNKYTAGPPYGENGVLSFTEADLDRPLFLIDGWLLNGQEVFIGQYSNYSYLPGQDTPFGTGTYSLTLNYQGAPRTLLLEVPIIFTQYTLYVNGQPAVSDGSGTQIPLPLGNGDTLLTLKAENQSHYYSGLTYPPALGTPEVISRLFFVRTLLYAAVCFSSLTLALFSIALWLSRYRDRMFFHFGLLCLAFSVHCAHPLVWQAGLTGRLWYAAEDIAWFFVLAEAVHLAVLAAQLERAKWYRMALRPAMLVICILQAISVLWIIPSNGDFINFYGGLVDWYKLAVWVFLALCAGIGLSREDTGHAPLILPATGILGVSILADVMDSNQFEPIYGLWQNEYAGVLLIMLFGGMMVRRNLTLLQESRELESLSLQYRFAEESAVQMRQSTLQVRTMKHELNHHIEALSAFCSQGDLSRLNQYLQELRNEKNALPMLAYSENFLVNAILSTYLESARRNGTLVDCRVMIPDELPILDAELCTLLSNLLQNAVEACNILPHSQKPFIRFEMAFHDNLLSFFCSNTAISGSSAGPFPTTKPDRKNHGLGLPIISRIAEKHDGTVRAVMEDGVFTVRGVLSLPPTHG